MMPGFFVHFFSNIELNRSANVTIAHPLNILFTFCAITSLDMHVNAVYYYTSNGLLILRSLSICTHTEYTSLHIFFTVFDTTIKNKIQNRKITSQSMNKIPAETNE